MGIHMKRFLILILFLLWSASTAADSAPAPRIVVTPGGELVESLDVTTCPPGVYSTYTLERVIQIGGGYVPPFVPPVPPGPVPPAPPPAPPKPGKLSVAIVERAGDRPTLTPAQIGQIVGPAAAEYCSASGHSFRVVDVDARTWKGDVPAYIAYPQKFAADQKLPAVIVAAFGKADPPLFAGPVDGKLLETLKIYGGAAGPQLAGQVRRNAGEADTPPGAGQGLLPRDPSERSRARAFAMDFRKLPRAEWAKAKTPRRRPWTIYDQGSTSSCASQSLCGAVAYSREIRGLPRVKLSPGSVYPNVNGGRDAGSTLTANVNWLQDHGAAPVEVVPANTTRKASLPPGTQAAADPFRLVTAVDLDGDFDAVVSALAYGYPVYFGIRWSGGVGHAIYAFDYETTTVRGKPSADLVIANSWGEDWGDGGCGRLTESQCATMPQFGAYAIVLPTYDP